MTNWIGDSSSEQWQRLLFLLGATEAVAVK